MANLRQLLNKKGLKGEVVAKAIIANTADHYSQVMKGNEYYKPILSEAEISKLVSGITTPIEGKLYTRLLSVQDWIQKNQSSTLAHEQQAQLSITQLVNRIEIMSRSEEVFQYVSKLPRIMTKKQYEDAKKENVEQLLKDHEAFSLFELIGEGIDYYIQLLKKHPRKKNPLKELKAKYQKETIKELFLIDRYKEELLQDEEKGYYLLPNGDRSDNMTLSQWSEAYKTYYEKPFLETHKHFKGDEEATPEETLSHYRTKAHIKAYLKEYQGMDRKKAQKEALKEIGFNENIAEWHYYDETTDEPIEVPAEYLNKWNILNADYKELFYSFNIIDKSITDEDRTKEHEAFKKEYGEVVDAILKDLEKSIPEASKVPLKDWSKQVYPAKDIYNLNLYDYKNNLDSIAVPLDDYRSQRNGVAIIEKSPYSLQIDEKGYYKEPNITNPLNLYSLMNYDVESEDYINNIKQLKEEEERLKDSYYYMQGYNIAIDLIKNALDIPELEAYKVQANSMKARIEAYNGLIAFLYVKIKDTKHDDEALQAKKLRILKENFTLIDTDALITPVENIEKARKHLNDYSAFTQNKPFSTLLTMRDYQGGSDEK